MSVEALLTDRCDILEEAAAGDVPPQDDLGGVDRSDSNWVVVATGAHCFIAQIQSNLSAFPGRDDARAQVSVYRVYFGSDPTPTKLGTRHRIVSGGQVYAVKGVRRLKAPQGLAELFHVDCEAIEG